MKLGILSDIHSNIYSFRLTMKYMEEAGCEEYIFLGDYVSDTPYTKETMEYLYQIKQEKICHLLRGNREEYMLGQWEARKKQEKDRYWPRNSASGNLLYTYERLTELDLAFLEQLPITFVYEKEGYPAITFCHGSPNNTRELMQLNGENTREWMKRTETDYLIAGHTHFPGVFSEEGKYYMNPGANGIAISDQRIAQSMILESACDDGRMKWKPTFLELPIPVEQIVEDIISSGLLDSAPWFVNSNIHTFLTGKDLSAALIQKAQLLMEQETGKAAVWPHIDEDYFAAAAGRLGLPDYRRQDKAETTEKI